MTIMTIGTFGYGGYIVGVHKWSVAEAKARFSEVIENARAIGPQTITRNGRTAAVVVASEEWERKSRRKGSLAEFFASSPLRRSGLKISRLRGSIRKTGL
jgi:prevent-host-death family protein